MNDDVLNMKSIDKNNEFYTNDKVITLHTGSFGINMASTLYTNKKSIDMFNMDYKP